MSASGILRCVLMVLTAVACGQMRDRHPSAGDDSGVIVIRAATSEMRPASAPRSPLVEAVCAEGCYEEMIESLAGESRPHVVSSSPVLDIKLADLVAVEQRQVEEQGTVSYIVLLELTPEADDKLKKRANPLLVSLAYHEGSLVGTAPLLAVHRIFPLGIYADADSAVAAMRLFPRSLLRNRPAEK